MTSLFSIASSSFRIGCRMLESFFALGGIVEALVADIVATR